MERRRRHPGAAQGAAGGSTSTGGRTIAAGIRDVQIRQRAKLADDATWRRGGRPQRVTAPGLPTLISPGPH